MVSIINVFIYCCIAVLSLQLVAADIYLHSLRGSNNRLNEKTATRKNNNRVFDSQNNARGGYNVGDKTNKASNNENDHYRMNFFQSGLSGDSEVTIQWTNQHGCGTDNPNDPLKLNCNVVLQYMCQDDNRNAAPDDSYTLRNGATTQSQTHNTGKEDESENQANSRRNQNVRSDRALHESWEWYDACYRRERNKGLFTADQDLQENKFGVQAAVATRQNPNAQRSGYECPEERDHFPYWHPTPWTDIAVFAHNASWCNYYEENSFNRKPYGECVEKYSNNRRKYFSQFNNPADCEENEGTWTEYYSFLELAPDKKTESQCNAANSNQLRAQGIVYKWGKPYDTKKIVDRENIEDQCFVLPKEIDCKPAQWSRVNHLGDGLDATPLNYTWKLPHFPSLEKKRCLFRIRYNISTDDYAPWSTDSRSNKIVENNVVVQESPIEQNPLVNVGARNQPLRLAINTAQFGRTFQDRSHIFHISPRPEGITDKARIINLNVRGKRGNIVQTYPAVEYDFVPKRLSIKSDDLVHFQWTGSNTHNNNAPGGDGQTGSAGEGKAGTDRSNILELGNPSENFPRAFEVETMFSAMTVHWNSVEKDVDKKDIAIQMASSAYYSCARSATCRSDSIDNKPPLNPTIDQASPSYAGLIASFKKGTYHYVCTRNNNFTNRSQKGCIVVS